MAENTLAEELIDLIEEAKSSASVPSGKRIDLFIKCDDSKVVEFDELIEQVAFKAEASMVALGEDQNPSGLQATTGSVGGSDVTVWVRARNE